ncbi:AbiU2 domain-containing protein [Vibrio antiquarius]
MGQPKSGDIEKIKLILSNLNTDLTLYKQLYMQDDSQEILNGTGVLVFSRFQSCLLDSIYLAISRLLDPANNRKNKNLSFNLLITDLNLSEDSEISGLLEKVKGTFKDSRIKEYRNKVLSHNDYRSHSKVVFYPFNTELISSMLGSFWELLAQIEYKVGLIESPYTMGLDTILHGDVCGEALLCKLRERT